MYETFYGLKEKPFNLTPDPRFLFLSEKHKEAFAHLLYGIKNRGGFVLVTGEIGTGKTTICRTLLNKLEDDTEVAFIFNPCLSPEELLRTINEDFGISSRAVTIKGLIDELNAYLLERRALNKNCVLVIDEAQNLAPSVLEQIRLLSNLETETEKLLQIVLIGQPELGKTLELNELRQLDQRITARYHLRELNRDETLQYIAYRLRVAGGRRKIRFTRRAVKAVYRYSGGVPRMINAICDRALLVGYTLERRDITAPIVHRATREVRGERFSSQGRRPLLRSLLKPALTALVVAGLGGAAYFAATSGVVDVDKVMASVAEWRSDGNIARVDKAGVLPTESESASDAAPTEIAETAEAPAPSVDFEALLDGLTPEAARDAAATAILRKWGVAEEAALPRGEAVEDLREFATQNGFNAEVLVPTLDQLLAIDLPAFALTLSRDAEGDPRPVWLGLVGRRGDQVRVAVGPDRTELVPAEVLEQRYTVQAVLLWRDPSPGAPVLMEGMAGDPVQQLQERLHALGRLKEDPTGLYDAATVTAVRLVQHETGLMVDGKVGRQTRMVLSAWAPETAFARLSIDPDPVIPEPTAVEVAAATEPEPAEAPAESSEAEAAAVLAAADTSVIAATAAEEPAPAAEPEPVAEPTPAAEPKPAAEPAPVPDGPVQAPAAEPEPPAASVEAAPAAAEEPVPAPVPDAALPEVEAVNSPTTLGPVFPLPAEGGIFSGLDLESIVSGTYSIQPLSPLMPERTPALVGAEATSGAAEPVSPEGTGPSDDAGDESE